MQITEIASIIIDAQIVPVNYTQKRTFATVTYLKPTSRNPRGINLPDCDSFEAFEYCRLNFPDGFNRIHDMISTICDFNEISFTVFSILHELGHWVQYKNFIESKHNDMEFVQKYEFERARLNFERNEEYKTCKDIALLNKKYEKLYAELPTEKYANDFALSHLLEYMAMV